MRKKRCRRLRGGDWREGRGASMRRSMTERRRSMSSWCVWKASHSESTTCARHERSPSRSEKRGSKMASKMGTSVGGWCWASVQASSGCEGSTGWYGGFPPWKLSTALRHHCNLRQRNVTGAPMRCGSEWLGDDTVSL
eukprot:1605104-Rhodomonas_salina.1